jgi:hypothetical protein
MTIYDNSQPFHILIQPIIAQSMVHSHWHKPRKAMPLRKANSRRKDMQTVEEADTEENRGVKDMGTKVGFNL